MFYLCFTVYIYIDFNSEMSDLISICCSFAYVYPTLHVKVILSVICQKVEINI